MNVCLVGLFGGLLCISTCFCKMYPLHAIIMEYLYFQATTENLLQLFVQVLLVSYHKKTSY